MYVLIMVKSLDVHGAGQYWEFPFYFGWGVSLGAVCGAACIGLPWPRLARSEAQVYVMVRVGVGVRCVCQTPLYRVNSLTIPLISSLSITVIG